MRSWPDLPPMSSVPLTAETLAKTDAVVLVTDHAAVDYDARARAAPARRRHPRRLPAAAAECRQGLRGERP